MFVSINSIIVNFKAQAFSASIQVHICATMKINGNKIRHSLTKFFEIIKFMKNSKIKQEESDTEGESLTNSAVDVDG